MANTSKNSTFMEKKKALDSAAWMNQPPHPIPNFQKRHKVSVFRGAGWSSVVVKSSKNACMVKLEQTGNTISVYDRRSIKEVFLMTDSKFKIAAACDS